MQSLRRSRRLCGGWRIARRTTVELGKETAALDGLSASQDESQVIRGLQTLPVQDLFKFVGLYSFRVQGQASS